MFFPLLVLEGVFVLGVTPSILIGLYFITGKTLGSDQLFGILLTLAAVGLLGYTLQKKNAFDRRQRICALTGLVGIVLIAVGFSLR